MVAAHSSRTPWASALTVALLGCADTPDATERVPPARADAAPAPANDDADASSQPVHDAAVAVSDAGTDEASDAATVEEDAAAEPDAATDYDACIETPTLQRQLVGTVCYHVGCPSIDVRHAVDLTSYDQLWGYSAPSSTAAPAFTGPFPGAQGSLVVMQPVQANRYVAAKLHTPSAGATSHGIYFSAENYPGHQRVSISRQCGEFTPIDPKCVHENGGVGSAIISWQLPGGGVTAACTLDPDTDYYLNVTSADACPPQGCTVGIQSNFTP